GILGKQAFGTGAAGLLGTIAQTVTDLQKGNVKAVLGADLGAINGWYHQVSDSAAVLGARYDQMASAQTEAHLTAETLSQQVSGLSSTDLASTLTALTLQSSTLKAALYATSKVVPESILAYL
ncbi:MAG: hypothetical protein ACRD0J_02465, partial [Acidimicrobiales bacterium]